MEFIIAIFSVGVAFLLLGIVGKVEAFQIKAGTDNKRARITFIILGILFISWASIEYNVKSTQAQMNELMKQFNSRGK